MAATDDESLGYEKATASNGRRSVTNQDLEILSLKITAKVDALATLLAGFEARQSEYRTKVDTNASEIEKLRVYVHDHANKIQAVDFRTSGITTDLTAELQGLLPTIRKGADIMVRRSVEDAPDPEDLAYLHRARLKDEASEHINREVTIGQRIERYAASATVLLFVVSLIIQHFWK